MIPATWNRRGCVLNSSSSPTHVLFHCVFMLIPMQQNLELLSVTVKSVWMLHHVDGVHPPVTPPSLRGLVTCWRCGKVLHCTISWNDLVVRLWAVMATGAWD